MHRAYRSIYNNWELEKTSKNYWKSILEDFIKDNELSEDIKDRVIKDKSGNTKIDLTDSDLFPYAVWKILQDELNYEEPDIDRNGWEQDFWIRFPQKRNEEFHLVIICCGMTHEIYLLKEYV